MNNLRNQRVLMRRSSIVMAQSAVVNDRYIMRADAKRRMRTPRGGGTGDQYRAAAQSVAQVGDRSTSLSGEGRNESLGRESGGHETVGLFAPGPHHGHELLIGHRLTKDVALAEMTTQSHDSLRILDGLDANGRC